MNNTSGGGSLGATAGSDAVAGGGLGRISPATLPSGAAADFARAMAHHLPAGLLRKESAVKPPSEVGGPAKLLSELSAYLSQRHHNLANMMDRVVRTGSPDEMLKVAAAMADGGAETDLIAKTVGKTVSALDQLTKLN